jgi:hypothetical protein
VEICRPSGLGGIDQFACARRGLNENSDALSQHRGAVGGDEALDVVRVDEASPRITMSSVSTDASLPPSQLAITPGGRGSPIPQLPHTAATSSDPSIRHPTNEASTERNRVPASASTSSSKCTIDAARVIASITTTNPLFSG